VPPPHRTTVSRGGSGVDFEDGAFNLLQAGEHLAEVACLRISLRAEHPHQTLGRLLPLPGIMETGISMDKTVRKVTDLDEQQAETYRYWQSRTSSERMNATWEFTLEMYRMKGLVQDAQGLQRSVVRVQRA